MFLWSSEHKFNLHVSLFGTSYRKWDSGCDMSHQDYGDLNVDKISCFLFIWILSFYSCIGVEFIISNKNWSFDRFVDFDNSSFEVSKGYLTVLMILIKPRNSIYYYSSNYMKFFLFCRIVRHREVSSYLFDTFSVLYTKSITTLATILAFKLCLPTHALTLFRKNWPL